MTFYVRSAETSAKCSACGTRSSRVHGRYRRSLADALLAGRRTRVVAVVRRFKCSRTSCAQSTYSEQIPGLTTPFARRTPLVTEQLVAIALALAGRAGARLGPSWACRVGVTC